MTKDIYANLNQYLDSNNINESSRSVIDNYFRDMRLQNLNPKTIEYNISIIIFVMRHIKNDIDKLTDDDSKLVQEALLLSNYKESVQKQYLMGFKRFLRWYSENRKYPNRLEYLEISNAIKRKFNIDRIQPSDLLTDDEIMKMINTADSLRDKAIIATLAESGCRIGELVATKVKDVKFNDQGCELTFTKTKRGKSNRTIVLIFAASYLATYLENHKNRNESYFQQSYLFVTDRHHPVYGKTITYQYTQLNDDTIRLIIKDLAEKVGIDKRVYPHLFRHTRSTNLAKKFTEPKLRGYMGWTPGSPMVSRYTHLSAQDMDNAIYEIYGIMSAKEESIGLKITMCKKCKKHIPFDSKICPNCYTPQNLNESETFKQKIAEVLNEIIYSPERLDDLKKSLNIIKDL
jgi:integrase/recombinase XerD